MEIAVDHRTPSLAAPPSRSEDPTGRQQLHGRARDGALRDVLEQLGEQVRPVAFARERTLPVAPLFERLFPEGLVRGHVVSCRGAAARSVALGLVCEAMVAGGWMAVIDVPTLGSDAVAEFGVPLERVVRIDTGGEDDSSAERNWVDVMGAAIDGFDLVLTRVPAGLRDGRRPAAVRTLGSRLQQKGAVVLTVGAPGALGGDVELTARHMAWDGLELGSGHLRRRVIDLEVGGRRVPNRRSCSIELVGVGPRLELAPSGSLAAGDDRDPQAELLTEMAETMAVDVTEPNRRSLAG